MHNCLFFLLGLIPLISTSQVLHLPELRAPLQATTYSKLQAEAFSFTSNQAALAIFKKPAFSIYGEKRFLLDELAFFAASAVLPTSSGNFGFSARRFGSLNFNETEAGLAYGRKLNDRVSIGAQFNYRAFKANGYGSSGLLAVDAGAIFQFSDELRGGFHVYKPAGTLTGKESETKLASVYEIGLGYDASDQLFLSAIANKVDGLGMQVTASLQYAFTKLLLCKAGISSGSASFFMGAGVELSDFRIDAITSYHQNLGITPAVQLSYHLPD
ncbi:hypothetical protein OCK74_18180 [Chitinophagaceae bacterium LB-8]|uniref:Uncharacterized protein n=1 Tax=Paraflavisolibacter caeni TaxID=2982496 RepID=A0A9X2XPD6_9BACT|nr:hypothetical protein [Paraflavisolibacter caeni]MCU7551053.1 hypothetical protein [Paraflavisolibacter caeni]